MSKFVIADAMDGKFYFVLENSNGQVIFTSKEFKSTEECDRKMLSVIQYSRSDDYFNRTTTKDGKFSFRLENKEGKKIGTGPIYMTEQGRDRAIRVFREAAESASIEVE